MNLRECVLYEKGSLTQVSLIGAIGECEPSTVNHTGFFKAEATDLNFHERDPYLYMFVQLFLKTKHPC